MRACKNCPKDGKERAGDMWGKLAETYPKK